MKREFDIKFRPQIESGEYKVETRDGRKARIICWDRKANDHQIVVLVTVREEEEIMCLFNLDGKILEHYTSDSDLLIVIPDPELTEFEKALADVVGYAISQSVVEPNYETYKFTKDWSKKLLDAAKKELCKDCAANKEMEYIYKGPTIPAFWPPCHYGGECTNSFRDCINCPRLSLTGINTTTGTSTSKVEG